MIVKDFFAKSLFKSSNCLTCSAGIALASWLLSGCGGSAGSSENNNTSWATQTSNSTVKSSPFDPKVSWVAGVYKSQDNFANKCANPRFGKNPATGVAYEDVKGSVGDENNFLRSWSNDTYLWYSELPDVDPNSETDPLVYFDLLKTSATTASGAAKDKFHFTENSADWYSLSEAGVEAGYGMDLYWVDVYPPREVYIANTDSGSPASNAGVKRGARILSIDGNDLVNGNAVDALNAGLFPPNIGEAHTFELQDVGSNSTYKVVLQSASITKTPVQNVKTIDTPTGKVGYFLFNDHIRTAEGGLSDAISTLKSQGVNDLVLDIRYNGGGYLYIASELAYMIAGSAQTAGKTFEKTMFNDKHATQGLFGESLDPTPFLNVGVDNASALPSLNLSRVYVITTGNTCSASESIINGLRGVGVQVIQIGSKTCGKPYGFYPQDNCGTTYFTIQFKGVNQKGFGEYSDGFVPSSFDNGLDLVKGCSLNDDLSHALGDPAEKNLATALNYRATGSCTLPTANSKMAAQPLPSSHLSNISGKLSKSTGLTNRIMK